MRKTATRKETGQRKICWKIKWPVRKKRYSRSERKGSIYRENSFFILRILLWKGSRGCLETMCIFWILHSTWMRLLPISMNVTYLTVRINMGNCVRNRKRHWKHLEFLFPIQISPEEETITGRWLLIWSAGIFCLMFAGSMGWILRKCRNMAERSIWKSRSLSFRHRKKRLPGRNRW